MVWLILAVAIVLIVLTVAAVLGRVDGALADPTTTMSHVPLPQDRLTPDDLDGLRFDTAMRGYRMSQVDATLDRLRREIADLQRGDAELPGEDAEPPRMDAELTEEDAVPDEAFPLEAGPPADPDPEQVPSREAT